MSDLLLAQTVWHRSVPVPMVIEAVVDGQATCVWFQNCELWREDFPAAELRTTRQIAGAG